MWNRCVVEWLKNLRSNIEYYDEVLFSYDETMDTEVVDENLWKCSVNEIPKLNLKYGKVCRLSVTFTEYLESLSIQPVVYENLELNVNDDVIMWKQQLRHAYCGEEENFFEGEDLFTEFVDESKDVVDNSNKPSSFPAVSEEDKNVQIRASRSINTDRPKTFGSTVSTLVKKKDDFFDFKGPCSIEITEINSHQYVHVKANEKLRLINGHLQIIDEHGLSKLTVTTSLEKGTKIISKTEVEMTNAEKIIYRFKFTIVKDAKLFIEMEKSRPSTSKDKGIGPFSIMHLLKLLKKRSSRDLLESKGIIKNEPIFGNTLQELCNSPNGTLVPEVITRIVKLIEEPENITSVGLYRASANLAVVQHIRCEINCGKWDILEKYSREVDVLTGTLKLFFRELKEPLIPYHIYQRLLATIRELSGLDNEIDHIVNSLPETNKATLLYIIRHLLNVCRHKNKNKMDIHNISICWGPSLILFPDNCTDLVAKSTEFTSITEHLLHYYDKNIQKTDDKLSKKFDFIHQVVHKLTGLIELNLDVEGIYRKSGSNTKIDKIMKQLEKRYLHELDKSKNDVHELCCVLKKFLGTLEEPLIPNDIFNHYCETDDGKTDNHMLEALRKMIDRIPKKDILLLLTQHLRNVVRHEQNNKMSITILTDIWTITLATPDLQQYKEKMQKLTKLLQNLINLDNKQVLPDLLPESESLPNSRIRQSKYDNVPDDINNKIEISSDKFDTKL